MKHLAVIKQMFACFQEDWMNEDERAEMDREILAATCKTLEQLDAAIETGVQNGHSVEAQLAILKEMLSQ